MSRIAFACLVAACALLPASASAQVVGRLGKVQTSGVNYATFAEPGEPTVRILVLGDEMNGIFEVGSRMRLDELVALAGQNGPGAVQEGRREVKIRVLRETDGRREAIYESDYEWLLMEPTRYPELRDGDILSIETKIKRRINWRDGLSILSSLSSIVLIIDRLAR